MKNKNQQTKMRNLNNIDNIYDKSLDTSKKSVDKKNKIESTPKKQQFPQDYNQEEQSDAFKQKNNLHIFTSIKWCQYCEILILGQSNHQQQDQSKQAHIKSKKHKRQIKNQKQDGIIQFYDKKKFITQRNEALKKKYKKIKQRLNKISNMISSNYKDTGITNAATWLKSRIFKLFVQFEKNLNHNIINYQKIQQSLNQILKSLEQHKKQFQNLIFRQKFIPILMEFFKKVFTSQKRELTTVLRAVDAASKINSMFISVNQNKRSMLITNRVQTIVQLLGWCIGKHKQLKQSQNFSYSFYLLDCLNSLLRFHMPENILLPDTIQLIFTSNVIIKLRQKIISYPHSQFNFPTLLKALYFIHTLTNNLQNIYQRKNFYQQNDEIKSILILFGQTDLCGILTLFYNQLFINNQPKNEILNSSSLAICINSIKIIINTARLSISYFKEIISGQTEQQILNCIYYLIDYTQRQYDKSQDIKDLLNQVFKFNQTIILIGYMSLQSNRLQSVFSKSITYKLCNLPSSFCFDKQLQQVLFPTLFCLLRNNEKNLQIITNQMSKKYLLPYLKHQMDEFEKEQKIKFEIQQKDIYTLNRSYSRSSVNSITTNCSFQQITSTQLLQKLQKIPKKKNIKKFFLRLPYIYWQQIYNKLVNANDDI